LHGALHGRSRKNLAGAAIQQQRDRTRPTYSADLGRHLQDDHLGGIIPPFDSISGNRPAQRDFNEWAKMQGYKLAVQYEAFHDAPK
jgi:hypothetical protein